MSKPIRLQRSRAKGSKVVSPNGLENVYIGRTGKENEKSCLVANPLARGGNVLSNPFVIGKYIPPNLKPYVTFLNIRKFGYSVVDLEASLEMYEDYLGVIKRCYPEQFEIIRQKVSGKNVVCWCKLDQQCHGDILLKLFND